MFLVHPWCLKPHLSTKTFFRVTLSTRSLRMTYIYVMTCCSQDTVTYIYIYMSCAKFFHLPGSQRVYIRSTWFFHSSHTHCLGFYYMHKSDPWHIYMSSASWYRLVHENGKFLKTLYFIDVRSNKVFMGQMTIFSHLWHKYMSSAPQMRKI